MNYSNILSIGEELEKANEWINEFTENHLSSPWVGYLIFVILLAGVWALIKMFADK